MATSYDDLPDIPGLDMVGHGLYLRPQQPFELKVFFFRGNQHIRYDTVNYRTDPGYPKFIVGNYIEDGKFFD